MTNQHLTLLTGASRGMGAAIAELLLQPGQTLICISRTTSAGLAARAAAAGAVLEQWALDLADAAAAARRVEDWLAAQPAEKFDSATLINNAAALTRLAPLEEADAGELVRALRVGLEAPLLLTSAFLRATSGWRARREGQCKVLNISSGLGRSAMASQAAYCAVKAGLDHFSRSVALDQSHAPHPARIVSLAPGVIDTDMQLQLRSAHPDAFPDVQNFAQLQRGGMLSSAHDAATRVLAWLERPDFGAQAVADVRDA